MRKQFLIRKLKICSLNSAYATKDRKKSVETIKWLFDFRAQMNKNPQAIKELKQYFDRKRHFLTVIYYWFVPEERFFRKAGGLNTSAGDWSNFAKLPDDLVFNTILGIDDGLVSKGTVYRLPWQGREHHIMVEIQILDIDQLRLKTMEVLPEALK
jgi:hypothetical protein